jgi:hypothetical protein
MSNRALPDLVARIRVDSSGVDSAMTSLIGSFGRTQFALAALGASIGLVILAGKSMMDIARDQTDAEGNLTAAIAARHRGTASLREVVSKFIETNRSYIDSEADVTNGFAALTREGVSGKHALRDMTIALDIAAAQHISLKDAVELLQSAEVGRNRGLTKLVGLTLEAIPAHATLAQKLKIIAHNQDIVAKAFAGSKEKQDELTLATKSMSTTWQNFATGPGKELNDRMGAVVGDFDLFLQLLMKMGSGNNGVWAAIDDRMSKLAGGLRSIALQLGIATATYDEANQLGGISYSSAAHQRAFPATKKKPKALAGGGPVFPNSTYSVGEYAAETLVMGPAGTGGYVIPDGGSGGRSGRNSGGSTYYVVVHVAGSVSTERQLVGAIREGIRKADRAQR